MSKQYYKLKGFLQSAWNDFVHGQDLLSALKNDEFDIGRFFFQMKTHFNDKDIVHQFIRLEDALENHASDFYQNSEDVYLQSAINQVKSEALSKILDEYIKHHHADSSLVISEMKKLLFNISEKKAAHRDVLEAKLNEFLKTHPAAEKLGDFEVVLN